MKFFVISQKEKTSNNHIINLVQEIYNDMSDKVETPTQELKKKLIETLRETKKLMSYISKGNILVENQKEIIKKHVIFERTVQIINDKYKQGKLTKSYVLENIIDLIRNYEQINLSQLSTFYSKLKSIR